MSYQGLIAFQTWFWTCGQCRWRRDQGRPFWKRISDLWARKRWWDSISTQWSQKKLLICWKSCSVLRLFSWLSQVMEKLVKLFYWGRVKNGPTIRKLSWVEIKIRFRLWWDCHLYKVVSIHCFCSISYDLYHHFYRDTVRCTWLDCLACGWSCYPSWDSCFPAEKRNTAAAIMQPSAAQTWENPPPWLIFESICNEHPQVVAFLER